VLLALLVETVQFLKSVDGSVDGLELGSEYFVGDEIIDEGLFLNVDLDVLFGFVSAQRSILIHHLIYEINSFIANERGFVFEILQNGLRGLFVKDHIREVDR
jgi:hypothetical protein